MATLSSAESQPSQLFFQVCFLVSPLKCVKGVSRAPIEVERGIDRERPTCVGCVRKRVLKFVRRKEKKPKVYRKRLELLPVVAV